MRGYEVVFILDPELADDAVQEAIQRHQSVAEAQEAQVEQVEHWGRRRLAYPIAHRDEGYYVLMRMKAEPAVLVELNRVLALDDQVLRHRVFRDGK